MYECTYTRIHTEITGFFLSLELTVKESQDLLHWSEATEALEAGESDGHLRLVVVVWVVLRKLIVEASR